MILFVEFFGNINYFFNNWILIRSIFSTWQRWITLRKLAFNFWLSHVKILWSLFVLYQLFDFICIRFYILFIGWGFEWFIRFVICQANPNLVIIDSQFLTFWFRPIFFLSFWNIGLPFIHDFFYAILVLESL